MSIKLNSCIGILGGGQLAKMLIEPAHRMGLKTHVYSESIEDPAARCASFHTEGSFKDQESIKKWVKGCDVATFESEFFDLSFLKSKKFNPSISNINTIRDRIPQKTLLEKYKIPTSNFSLASEVTSFKTPLVFKKRLFGYDGYGTVIAKNKKEFQKFIKETEDLDFWMAEDYVPFKRELALSVARNKNNDFSVLPLVETKQKDSKCFWVQGPVENKKITSLVTKIKTLLQEIDYIGIMAFELFEDQKGDLLVNEVAPRVHNSAHYSINALNFSQFDLHLMALLNLPLPKKQKPYNPFAMVNLLGSHTKKPKISSLESGHLFWYGKDKNRPGRKMGHMTELHSQSSKKALNSLLKQLRKQEL